MKIKVQSTCGAEPQTYETWYEDTTPFRQVLRLDAPTYRTDSLLDLPPASWPEGGEYLVSPRGNIAYQNRIVPEGIHSGCLASRQVLSCGTATWLFQLSST